LLPPCFPDQSFEARKLGDCIAVDNFDVTGFEGRDRQTVFVMQGIADAVEQRECIFEGFQQLRCFGQQAPVGIVLFIRRQASFVILGDYFRDVDIRMFAGRIGRDNESTVEVPIARCMCGRRFVSVDRSLRPPCIEGADFDKFRKDGVIFVGDLDDAAWDRIGLVRIDTDFETVHF
jgi:hypothetical protein